MHKFLYTALIILTLCLIVNAQNKDHYIVDLSGRTRKGDIRLSTPALNSSKIRFKEAGKTEYVSFNPNQIKKWSINNLVYESKALELNKNEGYTFFMLRKTPEKGKVHLYEFYNPMGDVGFTQTYIERDKELTEVDFFKFKKQMSTYFSDYKELSEKILNKTYKKKDLLLIIEEYNAWREYLWK